MHAGGDEELDTDIPIEVFIPFYWTINTWGPKNLNIPGLFTDYLLFLGLPSAPQNLVSTAMLTSATLRWDTPRITGSRNDIYYLVSCSDKSSNVRFSPSNNLTGTSVTVLGLTPNTNYKCIVTALNGVAGPNNKQFWQSAVAAVHTNEAGTNTSALASPAFTISVP